MFKCYRHTALIELELSITLFSFKSFKKLFFRIKKFDSFYTFFLPSARSLLMTSKNIEPHQAWDGEKQSNNLHFLLVFVLFVEAHLLVLSSNRVISLFLCPIIFAASKIDKKSSDQCCKTFLLSCKISERFALCKWIQ